MIEFANPYLACTRCGARAAGYGAPGVLLPCGHNAEARSLCHSWGPVDGCTCGVAHEPHVGGGS